MFYTQFYIVFKKNYVFPKIFTDLGSDNDSLHFKYDYKIENVFVFATYYRIRKYTKNDNITHSKMSL